MSVLHDLARALVPPRWRPAARSLRSLAYLGRARHCPCCGGWFRCFLPAGRPPRPDAACPRCGSLERHRLLWLYLEARASLLQPPGRLLYIAPEAQIQARMRRLPGIRYLSGDLESPLAMVRMDLLALPLRDQSIEAVICSHVLEHVASVERSLAEIRRVLAPGGWAILQSPFDPAREATFEDPAVISPEARERLFGQRDHVRIFGRDYPLRLARAGFEVTADGFAREQGTAWATRHGLDPREDIFLCLKRPVAPAAAG